MELKNYIRDVIDFPKEGIVFKDITPLLNNPKAFRYAIDSIKESISGLKFDKIACIESRGFIAGGVLASELGLGFVPIRKPGKLPYLKYSEKYSLEYGTNCIEIHQDAVSPGERVFIHDDLLATGGTMQAACRLIERCGGSVDAVSFIVELEFLKGREFLKDYKVLSVIKY